MNKSTLSNSSRERSARYIAWQVLQRLEQQHFRVHADEELHAAASRAGLAENDTRLAFTILNGCLRSATLLEFYLAAYAARPLDSVDPGLRLLLFTALYQILFLHRVADYAVVNETVEICKSAEKPAWVGFANGLLRTIIRDQESGDLPSTDEVAPDIAFSHPAWLVDKWIKDHGREAALKILDWNNRLPVQFARSRVPVPQLLEALGPALIEPAPEFGPAVVKVLKTTSVLRSQAFQAGQLYLMQPWSIATVDKLPLEDGWRVLDMCAAPGGKAIALADRAAVSVIAVDNNPDRLELIVENTTRCRVHTVTPRLLDARECNRHFRPGGFDGVLLDAPCSSLGVIQRNPEVRWRVSADSQLKAARMQSELLRTAFSCVRTGGYILYAVCSFSPEETVQVVHPIIEETGQTLIKEQLTLPGERELDGGYWALIRVGQV